jgi:hypothetical protein
VVYVAGSARQVAAVDWQRDSRDVAISGVLGGHVAGIPWYPVRPAREEMLTIEPKPCVDMICSSYFMDKNMRAR